MIAGAIIEFFPEAILAHLNDLRISVLYMSSLQGLVTAGCSNIGLCTLDVWLFTIRSSSNVVPSRQIKFLKRYESFKPGAALHDFAIARDSSLVKKRNLSITGLSTL